MIEWLPMQLCFRGKLSAFPYPADKPTHNLLLSLPSDISGFPFHYTRFNASPKLLSLVSVAKKRHSNQNNMVRSMTSMHIYFSSEFDEHRSNHEEVAGHTHEESQGPGRLRNLEWEEQTP